MIAPRSRAPYPENVRLPKLLLVEGDTPAHFFEALAKHLGIDATLEIRSFGGNSNFEPMLAALIKGHGFNATVQSLGIIRDAEADASAARQSVEDAVKRAGLPAAIRSKLFILPDNSKPGMIETLCLGSIAHKPYFHCVDEYVKSAAHHGAAFPTGLAIDKSRLQVYMAAHPEPQLYPGIAASRGYWPFGDDIFGELRAFLQSL